MKKIQAFLTTFLIVFSVIVAVLFVVIILHPVAYSFLLGLVILSVVIYWRIISYLLILSADPIYQNDKVLTQKFETKINIPEYSKEIKVFLCLQYSIGDIPTFIWRSNLSGFVKLVKNSTKKEYFQKLYKFGDFGNEIGPLTPLGVVNRIHIRSFSDIDAGDYTISVDTGYSNIKILSFKVISKS